MSSGLSWGTVMLRVAIAAIMAGALFQIVAANSTGLRRTPSPTRSGPTLPPTPPTLWHWMHFFSTKSSRPISGRPGRT